MNLVQLNPSDAGLVEWANSHLLAALQIHDLTGHLFTGLTLLRLSESVLRKSPSSPRARLGVPV
ncbi:hypothetical protein BDR03DRAFT_944332 [Suillus americanus]|nr:hypothetical protein BDR03DRAFT_944332 [Suillus americanus]